MSVEETFEDATPVIPNASPAYYRIFVAVVLSDGSLAYTDQVSENGPFSGNGTPLSDDKFVAAGLCASTTLDGYVSLIAQAKDTHDLTYFAERKQDEGGSRFVDPVNLGKPATVSSSTTAILTDGFNGLANVFALSADPDNSIWWKYQNPPTITSTTETVTPPGTDTPVEVTADVRVPPSEPWSDWMQIPGAMTSITATNNADGRLILAGLKSEIYPYLNFQDGDDPLSVDSWSGWNPLVDGSVVSVEQLELAMDARSIVHIFARNGSRIYMKTQTQVSKNAFTDWVLFADFEDAIQTIAVSNNDDGSLYVAVHVGTGMDSPIYTMHQSASTPGHWTTPRRAIYMREAGGTAVSLFPNADMQLSMFVCNLSTQKLNYTMQAAGEFWQAGWTPLGEKVVNFSVTQDVTPSAH